MNKLNNKNATNASELSVSSSVAAKDGEQGRGFVYYSEVLSLLKRFRQQRKSSQ